MSSDRQHTDDDDENKTSKMSVLVPDSVQDVNRSVVLYDHDGSKRNKLGKDTTDRLTYGLAMDFWRHPSKLEKVAQSEYVDDPETFKNRIRKYQEKHLDDTLVVARELLHGSIGQTEQQDGDGIESESQEQNGDQSDTISNGDTSQNRLGGIPRAEDARRDQTIPQEIRDKSRKKLDEELEELVSKMVSKEVREQMEVYARRQDRRLSKIEDAVLDDDDEQDVDDV